MVSDREVKLSGDAFYEAAAAQIRAGLGKDFPQGWQFKPEISVKPAAAPVDATVCQQLFADLLAKGKIRFESGRDAINPDSAGLLDRLVETAHALPDRQYRDCRPYRLRRRGCLQPDAVGKARAGGDGLSGQGGVARDRFMPIGYGSTQPVASNDTDEGKAQNRRIDFVVR